MGRTRILLSVVTGLAALPGFAAAGDDGFSRSGPYLGIGGIYTQNSLIEDELGDLFPGSETDFAGRAGAGVDIYLTRSIVLNAGANLVLANTRVDFSAVGGDKFDYLFYIAAGGSLQYRF